MGGLLVLTGIAFLTGSFTEAHLVSEWRNVTSQSSRNEYRHRGQGSP
jgi:hypothetical protein